MKDLKHLIYFENLLQEANNELVQQAKAEGEHALGYTCYFVPETLLNLPGCFSSRLRAPNTGSIDVGTYYMSSKICSYTRSILERGIEGGYDYLDALLSSETCQMMHRGHEHFEILGLVKEKNPQFFMSMMDVPFSDEDFAVDHYEEQLRVHVLEPLHETYGIDISDKAIRAAIRDHNEISRVMTEIGDLRKAANPVITGYEFHVIQLVSQVCPHKRILPYLKQTLTELKRRKPDAQPWFRVRLVVTGSEIDDPSLTKLIEGCGALIVSDRFCFGSTPGREVIELNDEEDVLRQICRHYMETSECARYISDEKVHQRRETADRLAREYKADGIIYEQMKYCDYWGFERALASYIMNTEYGWPVLSIDRVYNNGYSGQLRTRVQAFVESLEIKKIQRERGAK